MEKVTKKEMFEMIKGVCGDNAQIVEFCNHELELLARKATKSTATKNQVENEKIMDIIEIALADVGTPVTITELQKRDTRMADFSNQKLSALLKKMVENGRAVKVIEKGKSYFSIEK